MILMAGVLKSVGLIMEKLELELVPEASDLSGDRWFFFPVM
jgi:hypothetical protein